MGVTLRSRKLAPFGVEIEHDLSAPLTPSEAYHFTQLLRQHGFLLARGQALSMARQRELCALVGPILDREGENGTMSNAGGGPSASGLAWHADAAYTEHPFDALSLHALDVVDDASATRFIHSGRAWDSMPDELRAALEGRDQEMISPHYTALEGRACDAAHPDALKRGIRPAVIEHPHTGQRCVWVSALQTARLLGMTAEESREILHRVFAAIYAGDAVLEHRWRKGDVIFWDNIALQHMRGNVGQVGPRVLQRVIVGTQGVAPHIQAA